VLVEVFVDIFFNRGNIAGRLDVRVTPIDVEDSFVAHVMLVDPLEESV